jgi:VRR-NUC domain
VRTEPLEKDIQKAILEYLQLRGIFAWRNNTGSFAFPETKTKARRFFRAGKPGSGDIIGLTGKGQFFSIEVKRPGQKATPDQEAFMREVRMNNGLAFVAFSVDDVEGVL